ncbi:hypothetical protein [Pseudomonas sp.]|uniref:hypothetical protein n=1 Tax=Pseudomonas sp. TaxID=306 RepID=UPI00299D6C34|nr:hypothetical protein [Pseudomonas sp.]MDX1367614.1 hypothetical protein [Pseudomonas sp.]
MGYSEEQIAQFQEEYAKVSQGLQDLMLKTIVAGQESEHAGVKEHLLHGAARRLSTLKRCLENIFVNFPPTTVKPLQRDVLYDVQINLHAYVMNLYGIFDNWAWSFILRHDLLQKVGGKHGVGLFRESTTKHLAKPIHDYLVSDTITNWHEKYLKSYRDALAHRIPLYIPPAEFTKEESERYGQLEGEKINLIKGMEWQRLDELYKEQENIGRPSFVFLHSYEEEPPKPVLFHPQLLCDGLAIVEFGTLFVEHWGEAA